MLVNLRHKVRSENNFSTLTNCTFYCAAVIDASIHQQERIQARDSPTAGHDENRQHNIQSAIDGIEKVVQHYFLPKFSCRASFEAIKKTKGVDVVLRKSLRGKGLVSDRTLAERVEMNQPLYTFKSVKYKL